MVIEQPLAPRRRGRDGDGHRLARRTVGLAAALVADQILGEPPDAWHPVARFGQAMLLVERRWWADRRMRGVIYTLAGAGIGALTGRLVGGRGRLTGLVAATYVAIAGRALCDGADRVDRALQVGDLHEARRLVGHLVGRETMGMGQAEVVRAAVESVAENTVDAVVAPLIWAFSGGGTGVLVYRALNTMDAMVGHLLGSLRAVHASIGDADDLANWIPARATAIAVAAVRPRRAGAVLKAVRGQAPSHPSPNAGVAEASFAAAMGIRLGGINDYGGRLEARALLGSGPGPERPHIAEACRLSRQVTAAVATGLALLAVAADRRRPATADRRRPATADRRRPATADRRRPATADCRRPATADRRRQAGAGR